MSSVSSEDLIKKSKAFSTQKTRDDDPMLY